MSRRPSIWAMVVVALALGTHSGPGAATPARNDGPSFPDIRDHFQFGSVGTEARVGLPYWLWRVLPIVFSDKLPPRPGEGYERLGFLPSSAPHGRPIGTSFLPGRGDLVGLNCATCHAGSIRDTPTSPRRVVLGMPANQMDLQGYARFLTACASDPRFTAKVLVPAIRKINPDFSGFQALVFRLFVVGRVKRAILDRARDNAWFDARPAQGPGRVDTFNPYKPLLGIPIASDQTVGTVDLPSLWNQRVRRGLWLHWDGNNDTVEERNKSAAIGAGATPKSLDLASLRRIEQWIDVLQPPDFPADRVDWRRIPEGATTYQKYCAECHDLSGSKVGQVTDIAELGTDRERLDSFTAELATRMNTIGRGYPWQFRRFRKTNGYANMPLDGLWLRAPYLHNGSVPNLKALLSPDQRPSVFYRAYDVYDWENLGFVSAGPDATREGVRFDTSEPGNDNRGHTYGSQLTSEQKDALLEYLKTK